MAGKGIATAATLLVARFGFSEVKLNRIEYLVAAGNSASRRMIEKTGAIYEGVLRNKIVIHNRVYDGEMFSLIPSDLESR